MYRFHFACLLILIVALRSHAVSQRALPDGYTRRVWQTQDGLPESTVQAFAQTPDHYLWIGTSGGLVRFDGARFVVFDRENTPQIHENSIFCLTASRDGTLWAGSDGGGLVQYRDGVFRWFSQAEGLTNGFVRAVYEDRSGTLWAGTDDGLFRLSNERFIRADGVGQIPMLAVHDIREDHLGRLWVGGSKLVMIQGKECEQFPLEGYSSAERIKSIFETSEGTLWVGTVSGLQRSRSTPAVSARSRSVKHSPGDARGHQRHYVDWNDRCRPDALSEQSLHAREHTGRSSEQHGACPVRRQ